MCCVQRHKHQSGKYAHKHTTTEHTKEKANGEKSFKEKSETEKQNKHYKQASKLWASGWFGGLEEKECEWNMLMPEH